MLLKVGKLKSRALTSNLIPTDGGISELNPSLEESWSSFSFLKIYRLLDRALSSMGGYSAGPDNNASQKSPPDHDGGFDIILPELYQLNNRLHNLLSKPKKAKADQLFLTFVRSVDDGNFLSIISTEATSRASSDY